MNVKMMNGKRGVSKTKEAENSHAVRKESTADKQNTVKQMSLGGKILHIFYTHNLSTFTMKSFMIN